MPERAAQVPYTPYNAGAEPETASPNDYLSSRATPQTEVGGALQQAGKTGEQIGGEALDVSTQFARMATEAKVNDDYANKYAPAAADLRQKFDLLQGQDKVHGYEGYVQNLQALNQQFTGSTSSPYERQLMGGLIDRHIVGEIDGAKRELVESQKQFSNQATYDLIKSNNNYAASNYNNPDLVQSVADRNDAHITMQYVDNGHNPDNPQSQALIQQAQDNARGDMANAMITRAVSAGDVATANKIRSDNAPFIPGYQQVAIDNFLHQENIRQTGVNSAKALTSGQPLPEAVGAPVAQVQALVANTANGRGVDPNSALTVLRIESANGQNLGSRGTLGQDKGSAGKSQEEQAQALCDNLKTSTQQATTALGRTAEGWEGYAVYQQGAGGGVALLNALKNNPNAKAVDVLTPLYDDPKDALKAVTGNGGNATMSVSDFTGHIKQVYNDNFGRANCDFGGKTPGDAIMAPHQEAGNTVQPAASPVQSLLNFDKNAQGILDRINAIPNYEVRAGVMKAYNQERQVYSDKANAYTAVLVNQAGQLAADPKFTSPDQIPPEMRSSLALDHPQTLGYLEARAQYNADHQNGVISKDEKDYGNGYREVLDHIWDGSITSPAQMHRYVDEGKLTISGFNEMAKQLPDNKESPQQKYAVNQMQSDAFGKVHAMITHGLPKEFIDSNPELKGRIQAVDAALFQAIAEREGRKDPVPPGRYYNPNDKEYIGNDVQVLQMTRAQALATQINGARGVTKTRSQGDILGEALKFKADPAKQAQLRQEAINAGYYDPNAPQVPVSQ